MGTNNSIITQAFLTKKLKSNLPQKYEENQQQNCKNLKQASTKIKIVTATADVLVSR